MSQLKLHIPTENELKYRRQLISDEDTMAYNMGYGDDGSCTYHQTDMQVRQWYQSWNKDKEHFYAYIVRTEDDTYIGEVNAHRSNGADWYEMGIVLEAKYRGLDYAVEALNLLLKYAFETLEAKAVHNDFEETRTAAVRTHLSAGFTEYAKHDGILELLITKEQYDRLKLENYIKENLSGDDCKIALEFISFLRANGLQFVKDEGVCWKDKIYYWVKHNDKCVCFISIKDPDEKEDRWTVWSDDINSELLDESLLTDDLKQIAWEHVDHCGSCGSCGGGKHKEIFGKEFGDVCGCTFRFDNPTENDLTFMKKMIEIQCGNE